MSDRETCPICNNLLLVPAAGPRSDVLLVGEEPGWQEEKVGQPFIGPAGDILRAELARVGIQYSTCRVTNLWQHAISKEAGELDYHIGLLMKELNKVKHVLFMGSECAKTLFHLSVLETAGLKVKATWLPANIKTAMLAPNPAIVLHDTVGELRLSLKRFAEAVT
jgi:uracil-DNA glycosylase family 4